MESSSPLHDDKTVALELKQIAHVEEGRPAPLRKTISYIEDQYFMPSRYSMIEENKDSVYDAMLVDLFRAWDVESDGFICFKDVSSFVKCTAFATGLTRLFQSFRAGGEEKIDQKSFITCVRTLEKGTFLQKLELLKNFMNDAGGVITMEEVNTFIPGHTDENSVFHKLIHKKLGFGDDKPFQSYSDFFSLFEKSDRGEEAIGIFCKQILQLLSSRKVDTTLNKKQKDKEDNSTATKGTFQDTVEKYRIKYLHKSNVFLAVLGVVQVFLWLLNFHYYLVHAKRPILFAIAKGFGLNLRIITMLLFFTMARSTMGTLYNMRGFRYLVPMGFNIEIHSFLGFCACFHTFGHVTAHIIYKEYYTSYGFFGSYTQPWLINARVPWPAEYHQGDPITGTILVGVLILMAYTALNRGKGSQGYMTFLLTHFNYIVWLVMIMLHIPEHAGFFVFIGAVMILDRGIDFFYFTVHATMADCRPFYNGITYVSVPSTSHHTISGCYYRIKVPAISALEWHPFSLAGNSTSHQTVFFVASMGDWTKRLHEIASDPKLRETTAIQVQGPFSAPATRTLQKKVGNIQVCVASGVGITPFLSVMATKVREDANFRADKETFEAVFEDAICESSQGKAMHTLTALKGMLFTNGGSTYKQHDSKRSDGASNERQKTNTTKENTVQPLYLVWSIRDASELTFYLEYIQQIVKEQQGHYSVNVAIYLTGLGKATEPKFMMAQCLFLLALAENTSEFLTIYFGRPDFAKLFKGIQPDNVYYCGGKVLKDSLSQVCDKQKIHFHPEDFDSGAKFLPDSIKALRKMVEDGFGLFTTNSKKGK